ncbi:LLM class flavin-dependent oxidoreductase [Roseomonas sp. CAU 1739]|uniref:LLM class flavin-dependent oxidoreductase n=1 Tax=Roseomonas sp. CAU 1739 TaxID=3140364 RepID=UPI00325B5204
MSRRKRRMSLGLSIANLGYHYAAWRHPDVPADGNMDFRHFVHCARLAERGKLDGIFLADSSAVRDLDRPAIAREMEHQIVKHEPTALLTALAAVTRHIGLVPTASATYNEPFNLTRQLVTLDRISHGRAGWNMVTGFSIDEARNFGLDKLADSDTRHERAAEFVTVLRGLEDGGSLDHEGRHFSVRGSLGLPPAAHRMPIFTAGESDNAQELAACCADVVYGGQPAIEDARAYYASVKGRMAKYGREPDDLKLMPGIMAFVGRTRQEAQDKFDRMQALIEPRLGLGLLTVNAFPDYTGYDLEGPIPDLPMPGGRKSEFVVGALAKAKRENLTIRQLYELVSGGFWHLGMVGTPAMIADLMEEWFTTGAADGFNIQPPCIPVDAEDFIELVVPELQRRGLFRTDYEGETLSDHLGLRQRQAMAAVA